MANAIIFLLSVITTKNSQRGCFYFTYERYGFGTSIALFIDVNV